MRFRLSNGPLQFHSCFTAICPRQGAWRALDPPPPPWPPLPDPQVFAAAVAFATSLFWGGNAVVQDALVKYLETDKTDSFIHTFSDKLRHSLASFRDWKSELAFVTARVKGLSGSVHQVPSAGGLCGAPGYC